MNTIISHLYKNKDNDQWVIQTNDDHSKNVASLCEKFASQFGMPSWGYVLGILHDKGKESIAFQQHIKKEHTTRNRYHSRKKGTRKSQSKMRQDRLQSLIQNAIFMSRRRGFS